MCKGFKVKGYLTNKLSPRSRQKSRAWTNEGHKGIRVGSLVAFFLLLTTPNSTPRENATRAILTCNFNLEAVMSAHSSHAGDASNEAEAGILPSHGMFISPSRGNHS